MVVRISKLVGSENLGSHELRLRAFGGMLAYEIGEEEQSQHGEYYEQFYKDYCPKSSAPSHRGETVGIEGINLSNRVHR